MDAADSTGMVVALQDRFDLMGERAMPDVVKEGEGL